MYYCDWCEKYFEIPDEGETSFRNGIKIVQGICPYCGSVEVREVEDEDFANFLLELYKEGKLKIDLKELHK